MNNELLAQAAKAVIATYRKADEASCDSLAWDRLDDSAFRALEEALAAHEALAAVPVEPSALQAMKARKDAAYLERNQVVAALAKCFPSGVGRTAIEGWAEDWHGCVYIDLPTGQASWHFHDSQAHLFDGLPPYAGVWDGHDTPEKYRRIAALTHPAPQPPRAGYALVPNDPTIEMQAAWNGAGEYWQAAYSAMLAAAPQPQQAGVALSDELNEALLWANKMGAVGHPSPEAAALREMSAHVAPERMAIPADIDAAANSIAKLVIEWVDGGGAACASADWRPGLASLIARRLSRFALAATPPQPTAPAQPQWLPIESAPMNSKSRLVWQPHSKCVFCASWLEAVNNEDVGSWAVFGSHGTRLYGITHWMPIPEAPASAEQEGGR